MVSSCPLRPHTRLHGGEHGSDASSRVLPGNYTSRVWEYSSTIQSSDDLPAVQGSSSFSLKGERSPPCPAFPVTR